MELELGEGSELKWRSCIIYENIVGVMSGEAGSDLEVVEISSYVRGYHVYMDTWDAEVGQELRLKRVPENGEDVHAVAVLDEDVVVGHVPYNIAPILERFLRREVNTGFVEITGGKVNRGAGYGLEIPCIYRLYGPRIYCRKLKELVKGLKHKGLR